MNGWMSNTKGVLLCYSMLNCYGMFCLCITKDLLSCLLNVKLLRNALSHMCGVALIVHPQGNGVYLKNIERHGILVSYQ